MTEQAHWPDIAKELRVWDGLGRLLSRSDFVYLLKRGDREARTSDDPSQWPAVYVRLFREFATE